MATGNISIRLSPKELANVYNFLSIVCKYNTNNLPVSKAVQLALGQLIKWARSLDTLPIYETDADAIVALGTHMDKIPTAFTVMEATPVVVDVPSTHVPLIPKGESKEIVSVQIPNDNSEQLLQSAEDLAKQKLKVIDMIDTFTDKKEEEAAKELLDAVKIDSIYK